MALGGQALGERGRRPCQDEAEDVAEIVSGICKERERIAENAVDGLDNHESDIERDTDGEGAVVAGGRVGVRVVGMP